MNLPDPCRLHLGLYILSNKALKVDYDIEYLVNQVFGGEDPGVYEMLQLMDRQGLIKIDEDFIYLPSWPKGKSRPVAGKLENLSIVRPGDSYHPLATPRSDAKTEGTVEFAADHNLAGAALDRDMKIFLEKWPAAKTPRYKANLPRLKKYWSWLAKTKFMPPLNVLLFTLGQHSPKPNALPFTWMQKRYWLKYWEPSRTKSHKRLCPYCLNEERRLVFDNETGQKKVVPCSCVAKDKKHDKKSKAEIKRRRLPK